MKIPQYFTVLFTVTVNIIVCDRNKRVLTTYLQPQPFARPFIVNGDPATVGQIPYFVSIKETVRWYNSKSALWKNLCGGTIIAANKVVTAAHCFEVYNYRYYRNHYLLRVVAGSIRNYAVSSGEEINEPKNQWRMIQKKILHRSFKFPADDIALVFVNNFTFSEYIDYAVPATTDIEYAKQCLAVGFGKVGQALKDDLSQVLLVAKIDMLSKAMCSFYWESNMNKHVCSDSTSTDVAKGDSGGPLVCKGTLDPAERSNRDLLVGVVSGKDFYKTTLYTRVSAYKDWIERDSGHKLTCDVLLYIITCFLTLYLCFCLTDYGA